TATPIVSLDFDGDGVAIVDEAWGVWRGTVQQGFARRQSRLVVPVFVGTVPVGNPAPYLASTWSFQNSGLFLGASDGQVFQIQPRGEIVARADLAGALAGPSPAVVLKNEYPSNTAVHLAGYNLVVSNAERVIRKVDVHQLLSV